MITDTHTHLYASQFDEDQAAMIQRARDAGVSRFFIPAIDSTYTESMMKLEKAFPTEVFLMMGLHPTSVKENYLEELAHVKEWINKKKFFALGEIGIDLYWDKKFLTQQQEAFRTQIKWAKEKNLPIVIHCRDAFDEIFEILEAEKGESLRGVFHCFTGTIKDAQRAISYNLKLGIGGVATFKNGKIDQFLAQLPLTSLVVETDAPYLTPVPYRGRPNAPCYLPFIAETLAEIKSLPTEAFLEHARANSYRLFF